MDEAAAHLPADLGMALQVQQDRQPTQTGDSLRHSPAQGETICCTQASYTSWRIACLQPQTGILVAEAGRLDMHCLTCRRFWSARGWPGPWYLPWRGPRQLLLHHGPTRHRQAEVLLLLLLVRCPHLPTGMTHERP